MAETLRGKSRSSSRVPAAASAWAWRRPFHAAGAKVALGDLRQDTVDRAAGDLGGERTFAGAIDVRDDSIGAELFRSGGAGSRAGDIAVANAGVFPTRAVLDMDVEEWDRVIETNLRGTFLTCQAAAPA